MNIKRSVTWSLLAGVAACAAMTAMPGCELLVDFDRSKIPSGGDASLPDATEPTDGPASMTDGSGDGMAMTTPDAGPDGTTPPADASPDAAEGGTKSDAGEAGTAPDTGAPDTGIDAPFDGGSDAESPDAFIADSGADSE